MEWERTFTGDPRRIDDRPTNLDDPATSDSDRQSGERRSRRRYDFSADGYERMLEAFENGDLSEDDARKFFGGHFEDVRAAVDTTG